MAAPVFRLTAPVANCSDASPGNGRMKATPIYVFPTEGNGEVKTLQPRKEAMAKPKPLSTKPFVQSLTSQLETRLPIERRQSCALLLDDNPSAAHDLRNRPTTAISKLDDKTVQTLSKRTELFLSDISSACSSSLPITVQVLSDGMESKLPVSKGEVLNILAIKSMTVVNARSGTKNFVIPLNSSVPFSVLYNPESNFKKALEGYVFPHARALMKAKVLPRVVYVTEPRSALRGIDPRAKMGISEIAPHCDSIEKDEILVFDQTETERELHGCKAFSIKAKTTKSLSDDCKFLFSTCPELVSMFMTEIVQCIADKFPCKVAMTGKHAAVSNIDTNDITLLKVTTEQSLLCSNESYGSALIDIPANAPSVKVVILNETNPSKHLRTYASEMMQNYKSEKLIYIREPGIKEVQTYFYSHVRQGFEMTGVKLTIPSSNSELMKSPLRLQAAASGPQVLTTVEPRIPDDQANSDCRKPHTALNSQGDLKLKEAKGNKLLHFGTKLKVTGIIGTITESVAVNSGGLRSTVDGTKCSKSQSSEPIRGTPATGLNKGRHDHGEPVRDSFTHATCSFQATESIQQQMPSGGDTSDVSRSADEQHSWDTRKPHKSVDWKCESSDMKPIASLLRETKENRLLSFGSKMKVTGVMGITTEQVAVNAAGLIATVDDAKCSKSQTSEPITIRGAVPNTAATDLNIGTNDRADKPTRDSFTNAVCSFQAISNQQQIETRQGSESPPLYDTFPSSTLKESIVEKPAKMVVEPHHQSESSTFPRDGKKLLKPPPPKPYERPTPVKVIAATKPSMPSTVVKTNCDVEIGTACVEKDAEVEDIEGYTYVLMNPKDSNTTKHNAASVVSEIRSNNKQYLASLNIDEVQSMLAGNGLEQYMEVFKKERIDGGILSLLGEDDLRLELGIDSRLHRLRLMRIISGDVNIKSH